jgi:hypothetical protein
MHTSLLTRSLSRCLSADRRLRRGARGAAVVALTALGLAGCGTAGGYSPAALTAATSTSPVSPFSASFISASTGWLLGRQNCAPVCRLVMRKTVDGGRHWVAVPAPPAPAAGAPIGTVPGSPASAVSKVVFANSSDGWAFGPGLWATHDGGRRWHRVNTRGWTLASLAAGGGRVVAAFGRHPVAGSSEFAQAEVFSARVGTDAWRAVPGASGSDLADMTVVVSGRTGYLTAQRSSSQAQEGTELIAGPASGSGRWRAIPLPCRSYWDFYITLAASPRGTLALGCASQGFPPFREYKRVWTSGNGGRTWHLLASLPMPGYLGEVSVTSGGTVLVSGGHSDVYITREGAKTWHTSPSLNRADVGDGLFATMFTSARGFVLQDSYSAPQVWLTGNDARTWTPVAVR